MTRWSALVLILLTLFACNNPLSSQPSSGDQAHADGTTGKKGKKGKGKKKNRKGKKGQKSKNGGSGETPSTTVPVDVDPQVVAAYLADCHHTFPASGDMEGDPSNECLALEFDQNCAPDPSGCWVKGQDCIATCTSPCATCQDTCAATCDDCKSTCGDDTACLETCAGERAACRSTCMDTRTRCMGDDCSAVEAACAAGFDQKLAEKCPDCEGIRQCLSEDYSSADRQQKCQQRFPADAAECVSWCEPGN